MEILIILIVVILVVIYFLHIIKKEDFNNCDIQNLCRNNNCFWDSETGQSTRLNCPKECKA